MRGPAGRSAGRPYPQRMWNADPSLLDAGEVARRAGTDPTDGLTAAEATDRLERFGPNRLDPAATVPTWRKFLAQFADPLIYLLLAAIVVSAAAWALFTPLVLFLSRQFRIGRRNWPRLKSIFGMRSPFGPWHVAHRSE